MSDIISNTILIKHGTTDPKEGSLLPCELGYQKKSGILYIGTDKDPRPVVFFSDPNNDGNIVFGTSESSETETE